MQFLKTEKNLYLLQEMLSSTTDVKDVLRELFKKLFWKVFDGRNVNCIVAFNDKATRDAEENVYKAINDFREVYLALLSKKEKMENDYAAEK